MKKLPKIVIVGGATASGKTDLGVFLARQFNGEVISADSRQIYQEMDIGTAKPEGEWLVDEQKRRYLLVDGIRHYGLDLVAPDRVFSLAEFKEYALAVIKEILGCGHLPILVGGTGLYLRAIAENLDIPKVAPNSELRLDLEKKSLSELGEMLKKLDLVGYEKIDLQNRRRLVRALEVCLAGEGSFSGRRQKGEPLFQVLYLGLEVPRAELYQRIDARVDKQMAGGLIEETKKLLASGYAPELPSMSGIGYKEVSDYLAGKIDLAKVMALIKFRVHDYARRQLTWFRKEKAIKWVKNVEEAGELIKDFLKKRATRLKTLIL